MYKSISNDCVDGLIEINKHYSGRLERMENIQRHGEYRDFVQVSNKMITEIKNAVKFKIASADQILLPEINIMNEASKFIDEINLPFPLIAIELESKLLRDEQLGDCIIVAEDRGDVITAYRLFRATGGQWTFIQGDDGVLLPYLSLDKKDFTAHLHGCEFKGMDEQEAQSIRAWERVITLRTIMNLLCVLSCTNAHIEDYPKPSKLKQDMRKKKGKLPFFEFKVLTISSDKSQSTGSQPAGSHSSPRVHLRRGHIRKLSTKNIWVNSCVVGEKTKGVIHKDYLIK